MAIGMVVTFVVVPVVKIFKYLTVEPELHRKRGRAIAFAVVVTGLIVTVIGIIPMPYRIYSNGVVRAGMMKSVTSKEAGFVERVMVADGQWVEQGRELMVLRNEELDKQIVQMEADLRAQQQVMNYAMVNDPARHGIEKYRLDNIDTQLKLLKQRQKNLTVVAEFDGVFVNSQINQLIGTYVGPPESKVGTLLTMHEIEIRSILEQKDVTRVTDDSIGDAEIRLVSDPGAVHKAPPPELIGGAQLDLVSAALGTAAGGEIAVDPSDPQGKRAMIPQFEIRTRLVNPDSRYVPGQRAVVRLTLKEKAPWLAQWSVRFWQMIQQRAAESKF
jgi:putative peptide zinc metalloprotease protein